jgi:hypothetical protein
LKKSLLVWLIWLYQEWVKEVTWQSTKETFHPSYA